MTETETRETMDQATTEALAGHDQPPVEHVPGKVRSRPRERDDIRREIPSAGLRNYWYPLARAKDIRWGKAKAVKALKEDIVLFRAGRDEIGAIARYCPHRGGDMQLGQCAVRGTISCPYHGWTFDTQGTCLAVLGEGPESKIPGQKNSNIKSYPTRTLKGVVFVWIGDQEPAPIEEDVPPEFFWPNSLVLTEITVWNSNWRPSVENYQDAHVFFVHRNSLRVLGLPTARVQGLLRAGARRPRPEVVNGRALSVPGQGPGLSGVSNTIRPGTPEPQAAAKARTWLPMSALQDVYPGLNGAKWPSVRTRYAISLVATALRRNKPRPPLIDNREWTGMHLPGIVRTDNSAYIYTRTIVPIDENRCQVVYYHTRLPSSYLQRMWQRVQFHLFYNWWYNYNFSGQDGYVVQTQVYDVPENLSQSDVFPLAWRRFVLRYARGLGSRVLDEG